MNRSPTHYSWLNMIARCRYASSPDYAIYGGRGITVCQRWQGPEGFAQFYADMGERPVGKTLDRRDSNGNYTPDNCRWADQEEQHSNRRISRTVTYAGETLPLVEWAERRGMKHGCLHNRLFLLGWPVAQALGFEPRK